MKDVTISYRVHEKRSECLAVVKISSPYGRGKVVFSHQFPARDEAEGWLKEWRTMFNIFPPKRLKDLLAPQYRRKTD